jgi:hypothetical protein
VFEKPHDDEEMSKTIEKQENLVIRWSHVLSENSIK